MSRTQSKKRSFHEELVLNQWMMGFFKDGQSGFFHELRQNLFLCGSYQRANPAAL